MRNRKDISNPSQSDLHRRPNISMRAASSGGGSLKSASSGSARIKRADQLRILEQKVTLAMSQLHKSYNRQDMSLQALQEGLENIREADLSGIGKMDKFDISYFRRLRWREVGNILRERLVYSQWAIARWGAIAVMLLATALFLFIWSRPGWRADLGVTRLFPEYPDPLALSAQRSKEREALRESSVANQPLAAKSPRSSDPQPSLSSRSGSPSLSTATRKRGRQNQAKPARQGRNDQVNPVRYLGRTPKDRHLSGQSPQSSQSSQSPRSPQAVAQTGSIPADIGLQEEADKAVPQGASGAGSSGTKEQQLRQALQEAQSPAKKLEALLELKQHYELQGEREKQRIVDLQIKQHKILNP